MLFLYDLGISLYHFILFLASLSNKKAATWIEGRRNLLSRMSIELAPSEQRIWFHFASLGEFEQGRPVLEEIKANHPDKPILITFFSPSGYEVRKNYTLADHVFYLPLDTKKNAREFIRLVNPSIVVFTKYEYWYHYFAELQKAGIPLFIISGIFRKEQPFFKWYGGLHRKMLSMVSHFFVQNESSKKLLNDSGLLNVSVTGDTRFDRVIKNADAATEVDKITRFCSDKKVLIAGSTWLEDEEHLSALASKHSEWKFIIAPHEVSTARVQLIENLFRDSIKLSELKKDSTGVQVLIIDNIGMLSNLYQYGNIAYIGGGFGVGIHNTLEAAAFGMPVLFGPKYHKFQEAIDLISEGAAFSIKTTADLYLIMDSLQDDESRHRIGLAAKSYVWNKAGATKVITNYLEESGLLN